MTNASHENWTELDIWTAGDALEDHRDRVMHEAGGMNAYEVDGYVSKWQDELATKHIDVDQDTLREVVLRWLGDKLHIDVWYDDEIPEHACWACEIHTYDSQKEDKPGRYEPLFDATDRESAIDLAIEFFDEDGWRGIDRYVKDGVYRLYPTSSER